MLFDAVSNIEEIRFPIPMSSTINACLEFHEEVNKTNHFQSKSYEVMDKHYKQNADSCLILLF